MTTYNYDLDRAITPGDLLPLFAQTGWAANRTSDAVQRMLDNTTVRVGVWDGDRLIGFARAVTDGVYRAFIEDVVVDQAYRGQGIGVELVRRLLEPLAHTEDVALVCSDELIPFYARHGFELFDMIHLHIWKGSA